MPKISNLPAASAATGAEQIAVVQDGQTRRMTVAQVGAGKMSISDLSNAIDPTKGAALVARAVARVDAITLTSAAGLHDGDVIYAKGRATAGDGGGGLFIYSASSIQAIDSGFIFQPTYGPGRFIRDGWTIFGFNGSVDLRWFGAILDGAADDSAALLAALSSGNPVHHNYGTLAIKNVVVPVQCDMYVAATASIKLLASADYSAGITLQAANSKITCDGLFDGNNVGRSLVETSAAASNAKVFLNNTANVTSVAASNNWVSGYVNSGAPNVGFHVTARDYANAGGQGSTPRVVTIQGSATGFRGSIKAKNVHGVFANQSIYGHMDLIDAFNAADNGIYNLPGSSLTVGDLIYRGSEEALVNEANVFIDRMFITGGITAIGLQDATRTHIGLIQVDGDADVVNGASTGPTGLVRLRTGNTNGGDLTIGAIKGRIKPVWLFGFNVGAMGHVDIQNVDLEVLYDATVMTAIANFCIFDGAVSYKLKNWNVRIIDVNNAAPAGYFKMSMPTAPIRSSLIESVRVDIYTSDGYTLINPATFFRIYGAASSSLVTTRGMAWEYNAGTMREASWLGGPINGEDVASAAPTAGTWQRGKYLANYLPAEAGSASSKYVINGWRCTVAGTPGTWVQSRSLTGN